MTISINSIQILKSTWLAFRGNYTSNDIAYARFQTEFIDAITGHNPGYGALGFEVWLKPLNMPPDKLNRPGINMGYDASDFYPVIKVRPDNTTAIILVLCKFKQTSALRLVEDSRSKLIAEETINTSELKEFYTQLDDILPGALQKLQVSLPV